MKCTKTDTVKQFSAFCARGSKPSAGERAQREAGVRGRQPPTNEPSPSQEKPSAAASGGTAQRSTEHYQCSSDSKRFTRFARLHLLSAQRIYSAHRYTVRSAAQRAVLHSAPCYTARRATQRPALHCAQRFTAQSVAQCAALYTLPPSSAAQRAASHSAQHYTAPSTASHDKADRSKRTKHIQVVEYFSQRSTAAALKRYASV